MSNTNKQDGRKKAKERKVAVLAGILVVLLLLVLLLAKSCAGDPPAANEEQTESASPTEALEEQKPDKVEIKDVKAVHAGTDCSLILKTDDSLWAWGSNDSGRLGGGTQRDSLYPVEIMKDVRSVSSGSNHMAAIKKDGSLWTWGDNDYGQLGDGTKAMSRVPKKVMDEVAEIRASSYFTLALKTDGTLWAWGINKYGQLGDETTVNAASPVKIMDNVIRLAAGDEHALIVKEDGTLWGWGSNQRGQLMECTDMEINVAGAPIPVQARPVKLLDSIADVAAGGSHSMALDKEGNLWAWGDNTGGQLGNNGAGEWVSGRFGGKSLTSRERSRIMTDVKTFAASVINSAVLKKDGSLWIWGGNGSGQLGDGTTIRSALPVKVMEDVETFSLGPKHIMAVRKDSSVWTWGSNTYGELGDGYASRLVKPVKVLEDIRQVSTFGGHTLAVKKDGTLYAFGSNNSGQLGDESVLSTSVPKPVMNSVRQAAAGSGHSLCIKEDGTLWAWGGNSYGQLGNGAEEDVHSSFSVWENGHPVLVDAGGNKVNEGKRIVYKPAEVMKDISQVAVHGSTSYAVRTDKTLWAWGMNEMYQLGDGGNSNTATPRRTLDDVQGIFPQFSAVKNNGELWLWGTLFGTRRMPVPEKWMEQVVSSAHSDTFSMAVKEDGTLWAWGLVNRELLPAGAKSEDYTKQVQIGEGVLKLAADYSNIFLIGKDHTLWAADHNRIGVETSSPEQAGVLRNAKVRKVMENVEAIALGQGHVMVLKKDGSLWAFGDNTYGQLGDGNRYFVPRQISRK